MNIFGNVEKIFKTIHNGPIGKAIFNQFDSVMHINFKNISNVLSVNNMNTEHEPGLPEDFSTDDLVYFKFSTITLYTRLPRNK